MANGGRALAAIASIAALGVGAWYLVDTGYGPLPDPTACTATVGGHTVEVTTSQAEYASLIAAVGVRRELPARAVSIALATAYQESKINNIDYGDRDSLGIFQQRPSQGWGTERQVQNPYYATNAFYSALDNVDGYEAMPITEAAQEVQRSGFPSAYADHEDDARALASALTGYSEARFTCDVSAPPDTDQQPRRLGLTRDAAAVRRQLIRAYGSLSMGGYSPDGVDSGHSEGSRHYEGKAIDIFFDRESDTERRRGWSVAHYLVAQAEDLGVDTVIYDGRIWSAGRSDEGWRAYDAASIVGGDAWSSADAGTRRTLLHRTHVHVDVP